MSGGSSPRSFALALGIIRGLVSLYFIGADVVEVAPAYDHAEITAIVAATIAHDYLAVSYTHLRAHET